MTAGWQSLVRSENLVALERWQEALSSLGAALADDATAARALCLKAQCHLGLQQNKAALEAGRRALALDPLDEWPHRIVAIAQLRLRDTKSALREAREAVRLEPDSAHALHILAIAQLSRRKVNDAAATAEAAVAANPLSPLAHRTAASVASRRHKWAAAESSYLEALRLDPSDTEAALALGRVRHRRGDTAGAAEAYLAAGRNDPTSHAARRGLARLGVPVLSGGGLFAAKLLLFGGAQYAFVDLHRPLAVAALAAVLLALGCGVTSLLRHRAVKDLPEGVRRSLASDHRDVVLAWLCTGGLIVFACGVWAAAIPASRGGGPAVAITLLVFAGAALVFSVRHSTPSAPGALAVVRLLRLSEFRR